MNNKKFTLDELTIAVNNELKTKDLAATDSRQSKELSSRRIRGLVGENLISKPFKDGRNVYYTELHLNELIDFKTLQSVGLSEKSLLSFKTSIKEEEEKESYTLDSLIRSIKTGETKKDSRIDNLQSNVSASSRPLNKQGLNSKTLIDTLSSYSSTYNIIDETKNTPKDKEAHDTSEDVKASFFKNDEIELETWNEYKLSDNTILKVRANTELDDLHTLIEKLKNIKNK